MVLRGILPCSVLRLCHPGSKLKNRMKIHQIFPKLEDGKVWSIRWFVWFRARHENEARRHPQNHSITAWVRSVHSPVLFEHLSECPVAVLPADVTTRIVNCMSGQKTLLQRDYGRTSWKRREANGHRVPDLFSAASISGTSASSMWDNSGLACRKGS